MSISAEVSIRSSTPSRNWLVFSVRSSRSADSVTAASKTIYRSASALLLLLVARRSRLLGGGLRCRLLGSELGRGGLDDRLRRLLLRRAGLCAGLCARARLRRRCLLLCRLLHA